MEDKSYDEYRRIWRNPSVESTDIYPGLVVQDDRVAGSITVRRSRLPLWTLIRTAISENWEEVQDSWDVTEYDFTADELSDFLYNLLESRGEFARLLLEIANANREHEHWWTDETLTRRVGDQLKLCIKSLDNEGTLQPADIV